MTAPANLRRIENAIAGGEPLDPADASAFLAGLRAGSIDKALGLRRAAPRHEIICAAVKQYYPGIPISAAAERFNTEWSRYAGSAWQREEMLPKCPHRHAGTIRETFWQLLRMRPAVLSARQLRKLLALCKGQSTGPDSSA